MPPGNYLAIVWHEYKRDNYIGKYFTVKAMTADEIAESAKK